MVVHRVCV